MIDLKRTETVLIYEGRDLPKSPARPDPKREDQPATSSAGRLTENGKFAAAALEYKSGAKGPDIVRVYEKIRPGLWVDNGYFHLTDAWTEMSRGRRVYKFKLLAVDIEEDDQVAVGREIDSSSRRRLIPSQVKQEVWLRDGGKCVSCGAVDELHFDHIVPFSKGGTSLSAQNVQLLCARHNLQKSAKIQ